jgi:cytochrome c oxidase subunit IV
MKRPEYKPYRPYAIAWAALVLVLGMEILVTRVFHHSNLAPLFGFGMAGLVAMVFMDLRRSNNLTRIFAIAGVFWLIILLGMGVMDPATRKVVPVPAQTLDWRVPVVGP